MAIACITVMIHQYNHQLKYSLDDCVTYFDVEARYQLIEIKDYHIQDKKLDMTLFTNVVRYGFYENVLYVEFDEFKGYNGEPHHDNALYERLYGTYDIITEERNIYNSKENICESSKNIFADNHIMVDLNSEKSILRKWILELIPLKYRKQ